MKLFACDLDGTLFNWFHTTDILIRYAIKKVIRKGNYFTIATGRNMHATQMEAKFKNIPAYCVSLNGARILKPDLTAIYEKPIDPSFVEEILKRFPTIHLECNARDCTLIRCSLEEFEKAGNKESYFQRKSAENFSAEFQFGISNEDILKHEIFKINCGMNCPELKAEFDAFIESHQEQVVNAPYTIGYYELTHASVNKAKSLKMLANYLQVKDDDIFVYGDGYNDILMLSSFDHAFVPSNGCDQAKKHAEKVLQNNCTYSVPRHMLKMLK